MTLFRPAAIAASLLTSLTLAATAIPAVAAPADVRVRIEGVHATIIDRVVRSDVRTVRASSDVTDRTCDTTNAGTSTQSSPSLTSATVDALATIGLDFDGDWNGGFDDYLVTRLGGESQDEALGRYWAILRDGTFADRGGCQLAVSNGSQVLWVSDGHSGRPLLWMTAPASAAVGSDVALQVTSGAYGAAPGERSAFAGAVPEAVDADGRPAAGVLTSATPSSGSGAAAVRFAQTGWQRLKVRAPSTPGGSAPAAVASAAVAICVTGPAQTSCPGVPPGEEPRVAPTPSATPTPTPAATPTPTSAPPATLPTPTPIGPVPFFPSPTLSAPQLLDGYAKRRRVALGWVVTAPGVSLVSWRVESRLDADESAPYTLRASGSGSEPTALLRLPTGRRSQLRLLVTDLLGRTEVTDAGTALVPIDERSRRVKRKGRWKSKRDGAAWSGRYALGRKGATLRVKLAAGEPTVLVRGVRKDARIELRAGGKRRRFSIDGDRTKRTREVRFGTRVKAGPVTVKVLSGKVGVDGVAAG